MSQTGAAKQISSALLAWEAVQAQPHRFGGTEYRVGRREIGHVHGDSLVDIPFPKGIRDELIAAGEATQHHVIPVSGWVTVYLNGPGDVDRAVRLFRRSYELALVQASRRTPKT
ncbi:MAG TPA: luciferase family protein [Anaerolineales bacterium]